MSEDASTSLSRAEFDIENNWVGKGGDKWSIIPNSMCKTNTSLFITIFVKSLLSSSGLSVSGKKHEKKTRQRILQSLCPSLYFLFLFFAFFFFIVVVFVIHGHESAIVPFTLISLSFRFSSVAPRLHSEHREITQRFLSIRLFLFPIVHFTYLPFAMPSSFFFFFFLEWEGQYCTLLTPLPSLCA